jgi:hypothetical protein
MPVPRPLPRTVKIAKAETKQDTLSIRAEIESLFALGTAPQTQETILANTDPNVRTAEMGSAFIYSALVFVLLAFILVQTLLNNKMILSFKKDLTNLAKMKSDFIKLGNLLQTFTANTKKNSDDADMRVFNPTDTQVLISTKELRRLRSLERIYQDNAENLIDEKTSLLEIGKGK